MTSAFQSTHPARGATKRGDHPGKENKIFQSTHPARGATLEISRVLPISGYFNPRTPQGVRRSSTRTTKCRCHFNPRTPQGVRRLIVNELISILEFQSTHPARGATRPGRPPRLVDGIFQSTHPARGATLLASMETELRSISIHAPRKGCDYLLKKSLVILRISIHAPRKGCDERRYLVVRPLDDFNPRTPQGVRQHKPAPRQNMSKFQSTHPARGATFPDSPA